MSLFAFLMMSGPQIAWRGRELVLTGVGVEEAVLEVEGAFRTGNQHWNVFADACLFEQGLMWLKLWIECVLK